MFGNGFRARVGAEFFAASSSEFQWYCLPSAYVVLHDSMLVRCAFVHYGRLARVHACVVLLGSDPVRRADALGAQGFVALGNRVRRANALGAKALVAH